MALATQDSPLSPATITQLTDKLEALTQATNLSKLEKQEYIKEIQKLKYSNNELKEKLKDHEFLTNESQQQTSILTTELSSNAIDLNAENLLNQTLKRRLKQKTKTVHALTKENTIILETNKRLEIELERLNQKYIKLELDRNREIGQYQTKIIELQNVIDLLQQRNGISSIKSMNKIKSIDSYDQDDEEKSLPKPSALNGLQRERTLELKLSRMLSSGSNIPFIRTPRTPITPKTPQHYKSTTSDISLPAAVIWRNRHYKGNSTIRFNYPMLPIQQGDSDTNHSVSLDKHQEQDIVYTEYDVEENDDSVLTSLTQSDHEMSERSYSVNTNATAIVAHDELIHRQQIEYEMKLKEVNDSNKVLKKQVLEKEVMIKQCEQKNGELVAQYISCKRKMIEDWIKEKDGLIELYTDQEKDIWRRHNDKLSEMKDEIDCYKQSELKLKQKIKQMKVYKKDKELSDDPPPSAGGCYTNWFKF